MRKLILTTAAVAAAIGLAGCLKKAPVSEIPNTFTDTRDGQTYKAVKMPDNNVWMAENLNYKTNNSWDGFFGRLYTWNAAMNACPAEWHLPSNKEWDALGKAVGGKWRPDFHGHTAWIGAGAKLKTTSGWHETFGPGTRNGTDDYGFSARPGGYYEDDDIIFTENAGVWWTATKVDSASVYSQWMDGDDDNLSPLVTYDINSKKAIQAFSVRCVRDNNDLSQEPMFVTRDTLSETHKTLTVIYDTLADKRDGKRYKTVVIGNKKWMAENLNYKIPDSSWCYDNAGSNCTQYGRLYTWNAAKKACPSGWRLPSKLDWRYLEFVAGGRSIAGMKMKAASGWKTYGSGKSGNGTDEYGFSALPGGERDRSDSSFKSVGKTGIWWIDCGFGCYRTMGHDYNGVSEGGIFANDGYSVRCVADSP
jgi:uncharacterized protein (TIGR02145 family)